MQSALGSLGLEATRISALDGRAGEHLPVSRYNEARSLSYGGAPQTETTMASFASHYCLWERIRDSGQAALVIEDDLGFEEGFLAAFHLAAARIQERRYIRLFALNHKRNVVDVEPLEEGFRLVCLTYRPLGTQAYLLSPEGAARLVEMAETWFQPVDDYMDNFWVHGVVPYAIQPYRVLHDDQNFSYIQTGTEAYKRTTSQYLRFKLRRRVNRFLAKRYLKHNPPR